MADVFLSYRNTPERRAYVERLMLVLDAYGLEAWWDYGLEAGKDYEPEIMRQLAAAGLVIPLWCEESIRSEWVAKEAQFGVEHRKLLPARLQKVVPPETFEPIHAQDLVGWDGAVESYQITALAGAICAKLGKTLSPKPDKMRAMRALAPLAPLSHAGPIVALQAQEAASTRAWAHVKNSLDPRAYDDFILDYPGTAELAFARAHKRCLVDWAGVDQADPMAIARFQATLVGQGFEALERQYARVLSEAQTAANERAEAVRKAEAERAAIRADLERRIGPVVLRAAEAAVNGRPVAERAFPIELPGVSGWPSPKMIAIPPGKFLMGAPATEEGSGDAERPQHEVRIDHVFALGQHLVTIAVWDAALGVGAKLEKPGDPGWGRGNRPVINVSWEDAQAYLARLNDKAGLTGRPDAYRLPSEAEWEYACRAGTTTPFSFGDAITKAQAQFSEEVFGSAKQSVPVRSFPANDFGLHDMHGNVWEWCQDCWNANYNGAPTDGSAWTTGDCSSRVFRGGSLNDLPRNLRSANRNGGQPTIRVGNIGFRLARTVFTP